MCGQRESYPCPKCKDHTLGGWLLKRTDRPKNIDRYCLGCAIKQDTKEQLLKRRLT